VKLIISVVIALVAAIGLAKFAMQDPGLVVLAREPYTVKLPLLLFVLILIIAFAALYLCLNFVVGLFRAPKKIGQWNAQRAQATIQKNMMRGYAGLIQGEWSKAENALLDGLGHNQSPLMSYLGAAYAAQQQGHFHRRDKYLDKALVRHPKQQLSINLTRARLLYQAGEVAKARDCLEALRKSAPKNVPVARLLADTYRDLGDWHSLVRLMPALEKLKAFPPEEYKRREKVAYDRFLASPALSQGEPDNAEKTWHALPYTRKKYPNVVAGYAKQLIGCGEMVQAEKLLRKALNRRFDSDLIYLYGKAETDFVTDQIKLVDSWAKKHGDDANLRLTLARLYRRNEEYARAQELLKQLVAEHTKPEEACAELGALLEQIGEKDAALVCYKKGLSVSSPDLKIEEAPKDASGKLVAPDESAPREITEVMPVIR